MATSKLSRINLKTAFSSRKRIKWFPFTLSFPNCFAVHTETLLRRDCDRDIMAVVTLALSLTHLAGVFKCIHFGERFQEVPFSEGLTAEKKLHFQIYFA